MAMVMSTTDKEASGHGVKALVYGGAGTGKTWLCGTSPSPLIISAESGLLTLRHLQIPVIKVTEMKDVWEAYTWCRANARNKGFQTICLDSISEIVEQVLSDAKKKNRDPRAAYGDMATQSIDLVKAFRDLPGLHVLVTAKETIETDPITNVSKAAPDSPGKQVGPALPYLFDEVFHAATGKGASGETYHYLRTKASINAVAKDRSGVLDEIEYPDYGNVINKIQTIHKGA